MRAIMRTIMPSPQRRTRGQRLLQDQQPSKRLLAVFHAHIGAHDGKRLLEALRLQRVCLVTSRGEGEQTLTGISCHRRSGEPSLLFKPAEDATHMPGVKAQGAAEFGRGLWALGKREDDTRLCEGKPPLQTILDHDVDRLRAAPYKVRERGHHFCRAARAHLLPFRVAPTGGSSAFQMAPLRNEDGRPPAIPRANRA
jgi:hypothetical protein